VLRIFFFKFVILPSIRSCDLRRGQPRRLTHKPSVPLHLPLVLLCAVADVRRITFCACLHSADSMGFDTARGIWLCVAGLMFPAISKEPRAFAFNNCRAQEAQNSLKRRELLTQQSVSWLIWIFSSNLNFGSASSDMRASWGRRYWSADLLTCVWVTGTVLVVCSWRHGYHLVALCVWQFSGSCLFEWDLLYCITVSPTCFVVYCAITRE